MRAGGVESSGQRSGARRFRAWPLDVMGFSSSYTPASTPLSLTAPALAAVRRRAAPLGNTCGTARCAVRLAGACWPHARERAGPCARAHISTAETIYLIATEKSRARRPVERGLPVSSTSELEVQPWLQQALPITLRGLKNSSFHQRIVSQSPCPPQLVRPSAPWSFLSGRACDIVL